MSPRRFRPAARVALFLAAQGRCANCGIRLEAGWHADHVDPVARGGATRPANGQALCPPCNLAKGARPA
ncbi:MAG TPA: HNH endonuclease signature motif containing protein [Solirubrobacteraceae bacterium]|nr:HNH endonuclease signature motif containing protein [Solirubrobacteraceae bacterium]